MPKKNKKEEEEQQQGSPAWMTTYGDMMTLLLCFFVLLFTFSSLDTTRFEMVISALQDRMGVMPGGRTIKDEQFFDAGLEGIELGRNLEEVFFQVSEYVKEQELDDEIKLVPTERGLLIRFTGRTLFDLGKAEIKPEARQVLDEVAVQIRDINNMILVEGHTDNLPISTAEFPSNWELSTARATQVVRYFIESKGLEPFRFSAAGYSEYHPIRPNDSPENRAINRRVDLLILRDELDRDLVEEED